MSGRWNGKPMLNGLGVEVIDGKLQSVGVTWFRPEVIDGDEASAIRAPRSLSELLASAPSPLIRAVWQILACRDARSYAEIGGELSMSGACVGKWVSIEAQRLGLPTRRWVARESYRASAKSGWEKRRRRKAASPTGSDTAVELNGKAPLEIVAIVNGGRADQ